MSAPEISSRARRWRRRLAIALAAIVSLSSAAASPDGTEKLPPRAEKQLSLAWASPNPSGAAATLRLVDATGTESAIELRVPWRGELAFVPPARLRLETAAVWMPETLLDDAQPAEIAVWPATELRGRLAPASPVPPSLELSFQPVRLDPKVEAKTAPAGRTACRLQGRTLACPVPAAALDLKLEAPGFVPFYFWNRTFKADEPLELGALQLEKGASIAGWVALPPGVPGPVEVGIEPATTGFEGDPVLGTQLARKRREARVDERGFFQLRGVEPGAFTAAARTPGWPDGPAVPLVVERDREVMVPEVLELPEPGRVRVFLEPGSRPWTFLLLSRQHGSQLEEIVREGTPDESGWLELSGLRNGDFRYRVDDPAGAIWKSGELAIAGGDNPPLIVEIPQIPVEGLVLLGKEPVAAKILFGAMGEQQIPVHSDDDGHFEASLPRSGRWEMAAELPQAGYVRLPAVQVPQDGGELTLNIPGASVAGRVYEDGKPKAGVPVLVQEDDNAGKRILGTGLSDAEGRFRTTGLPGGKILVWARSQDRQSKQLQVDLEDGDSESDIRLDLIASQRISGRLLADGTPLPGGKVFAVPVPSQLGRTTAFSGIDGRFEILLPAGSTGAHLIGLARGYAAAIESLPPHSVERDLQLRSSSGELVLRGLVCQPGSHVLAYGAVRLDLFEVWIALLSADLATDGFDVLTLKNLPTGPYLVCESATGKCSEAVVTAGGSATMEFVPLKEESP